MSVRALVTVVLAVLTPIMVAVPAASGGLPAGETRESDPAADWRWETVFVDGFDGPAGTPSDQWHAMLGFNGALQTGTGQLEVGRLSQVRSNTGWTLPVGTEVRVTASLLMPDTSSNYAAFWVQHPNGDDPREIDVIESYGPHKSTGAQIASHLCYDDTPETAVNACAATGRAPVMLPVTPSFPVGAEPWATYWSYSAEFTIGGDTVAFDASDAEGARTYDTTLLPDPRRVPGNALPFQVRLSNKDVLPEHAVPGGSRSSMLVDWVSVQVRYP